MLTAALQWPLRAVTGLSGQLASRNASARKVRLAGAVIPIMLATGLATALLSIQTSKTSMAEQALTENLRADAVVGSAAGGLPVDFVATVRKQPGVAAASALVPSSAHFPQTEFEDEPEWAGGGVRVPVQGLSAGGAGATVAVPVVDGSLEDLHGHTVALPRAYAEDYGVGVGDTIRMRLGDGDDAQPTVVAVFEARVGYESLLMPASLVVEHSDSGLVPQVLVRTEPGSSPRQLAATLAGLPKTPPGMRVTGPDEAVAAQAEQEQTGTWVNYLLVAVLVGYAVIALVNTLVIATGERRRELALQRLIGATRGQVLRMMFTESILVTAVGIVLGTAIALATVIPFNVAIGNESLLGGPLWIYLAVAGSTTALALATTMLTTVYTLRARPVEAAVAPDE